MAMSAQPITRQQIKEWAIGYKLYPYYEKIVTQLEKELQYGLLHGHLIPYGTACVKVMVLVHRAVWDASISPHVQNQNFDPNQQSVPHQMVEAIYGRFRDTGFSITDMVICQHQDDYKTSYIFHATIQSN